MGIFSQSVYLFFILISIFFSSLITGTIPDRMEQLILEGKDQFYNFNIQKSQQTFKTIQQEFPNYPHGYFYESYLTLIIYTQDMNNDSLVKTLEEQVDIAIDVANEYKKGMEDNTDANFHLGLCYGVKGIYQVMNRSYFGSFFTGRKAKGYLEKVVKLDSTYYDAYLGLGIVHYYLDLMPGIVKFLAGILGFDGDRDLGRREILLTANSGKFFKEEAYFTYYIIRYFLEGDKQNAIEKIEEMSYKYPGNAGITLLLGYHNRRFGYIEKSLKYCQSIPDSFKTILPQITDMKYYNIAVANYDLNQFEKSDSIFNYLIRLRTRKSLYYQAAINYYKGLLAALMFDHEKSRYYFKNIFEHKQTKYWYFQSRMLLEYQIDSLMYHQIYARNLLYSRNFNESLTIARRLQEMLSKGIEDKNPDLPLLVTDLIGENYYYTHKYSQAKKYYESISSKISKMNDEFRRAWVYIHYARCLVKTGEYNLAEEMLDKAHELDEEFTRITISRERYILGELKQRHNNSKVKT
jgi:tetratricopeptide (TPR) repeat protein